jgi:hypothetical protein
MRSKPAGISATLGDKEKSICVIFFADGPKPKVTIRRPVKSRMFSYTDADLDSTLKCNLIAWLSDSWLPVTAMWSLLHQAAHSE